MLYHTDETAESTDHNAQALTLGEFRRRRNEGAKPHQVKSSLAVKEVEGTGNCTVLGFS